MSADSVGRLGAPPAPQEARLGQIVEAATRLFCRVGYRRTKTSQVAREAGIANGTLYLYVSSKEMLFDLCVQRAFGGIGPPSRLPSAEEQLRIWIRGFEKTAEMTAALERSRVEDVRSEFRTLIQELYAFLDRYGHGMRLIERSSLDRPDLAKIVFEEGRGHLLEVWVRYLERRIAGRYFRPVPDVAITARFILESIAWFAWHRHEALVQEEMDEEKVQETLFDLLIAALSPTSP
jgi:AcrR family transcriptional regulator